MGLKRLARLGLTIALLVGVFWFFDIPVASLHTHVAVWGWVALALLLRLTLVPLFAVSRWRFILRLIGVQERLTTLWAINLKALFMGLFLPGGQGSDLCRIALIEQRHPQHTGLVGSSVFIERAIGVSLLSLWALLALPLFHGQPGFGAVAAMVAALNLAVAGGLALLYLSRRLAFQQAAGDGLAGRVLRWLGRFHGGVVGFPYRNGLLMTLVFIAGYQLSLVLIVALLFLAFGQTVPFTRHLLFFPLIAALALAPVTIGGFGLREGAFVWFYALVGVPPEIAVGVSLTNYLISNMAPALIGGLLLLWSVLANPTRGRPA